MGDSGYRGVSAAQDGRFGNKDRKLIRQLEASNAFPSNFNKKVDLRKVSLQVIKPWIENKVQELLGFEDDVVTEYVMGQLESDEMQPHPDPRQMQVSLIGFLDSSTQTFMAELWTLLLSAQESVGGIPREFVEKKKEEMRLAREKDQAAIRASGIRGGNRFQADSRQGLPPRPLSRTASRPEFTDKRGNRTSRVQDSGWGSRARAPVGGAAPEEDRYSYRRRVDEDDHYRRSRNDDRQPYRTRRDDDRHYDRPPQRDRYAERQQRQRNDDHGNDDDAYRYARRRSLSHSPERRTHARRSRSPTPVRSRQDTRTRSYTRSISRSRSRSRSRSESRSRSRARSRSRTPLTSSSYSRSPSPRRGQQRASTDTHRRYRNTTSRSRSPTRSISRSISCSPRTDGD